MNTVYQQDYPYSRVQSLVLSQYEHCVSAETTPTVSTVTSTESSMNTVYQSGLPLQ